MFKFQPELQSFTAASTRDIASPLWGLIQYPPGYHACILNPSFPPRLGLRSLGSGVGATSLALLEWGFSRDFTVVGPLAEKSFIVHGGSVCVLRCFSRVLLFATPWTL